MDSTLRCNDLKCRGLCPDQAVVTTCSHIFCVPCAGRLGLTEPPRDGYRTCPACSTQLTNLDDAVVTSLNPAEDYKTSILSGLSPTIIMECAGRGLAFWAYQMVQEITFQDFMARSLTERYQGLEAGMAETERALRASNDKLNHSLKAAHSDNEALHRKVESLAQQLRSSNKGLEATKSMYNRLKQQQLAAGLELAADQGAEDILMQAGSRQPFQASQRPLGQAQQRVRTGSNVSGASDERRQSRTQSWPQGNQPTYAQHNINATGYQPGPSGSFRSGLSATQSMALPPGSQNRSRLPMTHTAPYNQSLLGGGSRAGMVNGTPSQGQYNGTTGSSSNAYGLSAGMRVGRPNGATISQNRGGSSNGLGANYAGMMMR